MNLCVSRNLDDITPSRLPPLDATPGVLRLLYVGIPIIGFGTLTRELRAFCEHRPDVHAVHVSLVNSTPMKCLNRLSPIPWNCHLRVWRSAQMWRRKLYRWCRPGGPLDIRRFDAVLVSPQPYAWAFCDLKDAGHDFTLAVNIDATTANIVRDFGDSRLTTFALHRADQHVFDHADLITCMGNWSRHSVVNDYGVRPERTMLVPPIAPPVTTHARHDHAGLPRIVLVGHDWKRKGGPELLAWHQQHWRDRAELHFIGGDGIPKFRSPPRNVTFHGRQPRERVMHELLPGMDLFVMPTKRDMSPWALLEAAAIGLPVVSTRVGGVPDLVDDGITGFLAERDNHAGYIAAIERLIADRELRRRMGEAGRAHAQRFNREAVYSRLIDRLKSLYHAPALAPAA
ncbi:MAG TPA: glycosyltransferase family 4 protein [Phycisphaerales bacterium]|nr:glycosyltransferase family 4 protein [Phycisphaerales bacterium]